MHVDETKPQLRSVAWMNLLHASCPFHGWLVAKHANCRKFKHFLSFICADATSALNLCDSSRFMEIKVLFCQYTRLVTNKCTSKSCKRIFIVLVGFDPLSSFRLHRYILWRVMELYEHSHKDVSEVRWLSRVDRNAQARDFDFDAASRGVPSVNERVANRIIPLDGSKRTRQDCSRTPLQRNFRIFCWVAKQIREEHRSAPVQQFL